MPFIQTINEMMLVEMKTTKDKEMHAKWFQGA